MINYTQLINKVSNDTDLEREEFRKVKGIKNRKLNAMNEHFIENERPLHNSFNDKFFSSIDEKLHVLAILNQIKR